MGGSAHLDLFLVHASSVKWGLPKLRLNWLSVTPNLTELPTQVPQQHGSAGSFVPEEYSPLGHVRR